MASQKVKNRTKKMNFCRQRNQRTGTMDNEVYKYYDEIYTKRTRELLEYTNEKLSRTTGRGV